MTIEKYVRVIVATLVLINVALAIWVDPWWRVLATLVGANLVQSAFTDGCLAEKILKHFGVKSGC